MRIIGPPGTGKTTFLQKKVEEMCEFFHKKEICLTSFTRSAARVLAERIKGIENIGTLHSMCYENIGKPNIIETPQGIAAWNKQYPQYRLSENSKKNIDDMAMEEVSSTDTDAMMSSIQIKRNKMIPVAEWDDKEQYLFKLWYDFKFAHDYWDFTDMIEHNLMSIEAPPMNPSVFIVDEAQDLTSLEVALVKKWAGNCDVSFVAGDSDQCLYSFKGAEPHDFQDIDDDVHILEQSYRIPNSVHRYAERIIKRIADREKVSYLPKKEEGFVKHVPHNYKSGGRLIKEIECDLSEGNTVMLISSCGYMIDSVRDSLRKSSIPFHNPYRVKRGDWNPIRKGGSVSSVVAFYQKRLDAEGFLLWQKHLKRAVFVKGINKEIEKLEKDAKAIDYIINNYLTDEVRNNLGNVDWYVNNCGKAKQKAMEYPRVAIKKYGVNIDPKVIIGTIHSVKGGESDIVYMFPDLSARGYNNMDDSVHRAFYVGATRARKGLKLCKPFTRSHYKW